MRQIALPVLAVTYVAYQLDDAFLGGCYAREVKWYVLRSV